MTVTAELINDGKEATAFRCHALSAAIACHPMSSVIEASESFAVEVCFTPNEVGIQKCVINFEQRGGSVVPMAIKADVRIPTAIRFLEKILNFGTLNQGASKALPLTLVNDDCISCEIEIDLSEESLITLSLGPGQWESSSGNSIPLEDCTSLNPEHEYALLMSVLQCDASLC